MKMSEGWLYKKDYLIEVLHKVSIKIIEKNT